MGEDRARADPIPSATERDAATAQLAALEADQVALAERIVQPWWWDGALGLLFAGFISSYSTHSGLVIGAALLVFLAGVRALEATYRRITGVWWDAREVGPVQNRVRRATRWWLVGCLGAMAIGAAAEFLLDVRGAMVVAGVALGIGVALSSRWVTRIYVAGLRAGR
ncbi:hypothetical protein O2W15_19270 [Modestobacter sp. VKM Ac-2979]|uniref:hypothetical protein n=1 Tax=unclassified Modestobacter TaxID=2643866 RepID=UPI0022AB6F51|nr:MULTISPECIES: hypothetical protein [unclassified Modestobacter]MCZ2813573.1 hypothetical protein [Modestobacter sp. VKM Ac-2979]MCZ2842235.1 hypothetical protein [Modestobacter sp. VKM Ac-2980]